MPDPDCGRAGEYLGTEIETFLDEQTRAAEIYNASSTLLEVMGAERVQRKRDPQPPEGYELGLNLGPPPF